MASDSPRILSRVSEFRQKRGLSVTDLAGLAGVTRQAVHAMETGGYVPNTAVALQVARILRTTVDDLFALADTAIPIRTEGVRMLPGSGQDKGQPVHLALLDGRYTAVAVSPVSWYLPAGDAVISGRDKVEVFEPRAEFEHRILIAGCDPGMGVLAHHLGPAAHDLILVHRNSSEALDLVDSGLVHIGGMHWRYEENAPDPNVSAALRCSPDGDIAVISYATWSEGLCTAPGNPKNILAIADFARPDVTMINREEGAGTRRLLDRSLKLAGISHETVNGSDNTTRGHLPAAWHVHAGVADVCIATEAAARAFGLDFIPLAQSRYDLAIRKTSLELPQVQRLLDVLTNAVFRRQLEALGGYDTRVTAQRVL